MHSMSQQMENSVIVYRCDSAFKFLIRKNIVGGGGIFGIQYCVKATGTFEEKRSYTLRFSAHFSRWMTLHESPFSTYRNQLSSMISIGCGSYYTYMLHHNLCQNPISHLSVESRILVPACPYISCAQ